MKIAIYADDYIGNRGISVVGYELLTRLLKKPDLQFLVIGNKHNINKFNEKFGEFISYSAKASIKTHVYHVRILRTLRKRFLDYLIIKNVDVFWYLKNYGTYRLHKKARVLVTVHDLMGYIKPELQGGRKSIRRSMERNINVKTLAYADKLLAVSKFTAKQLAIIFNTQPNQLQVISDCVDSYIFTPLKKIKIILYAGAFNEHKNIDLLITSFLKSDLKSKGWKLTLIGPNSKIKGCLKNKTYRTYCEETSIEILPEMKEYKNLKLLYGSAYCLASTSKYEGFGLSILEGMSAGARIIASNIESHRELCGNSKDCQLIPLDADEEWVKAFNNLDNDFKQNCKYSELNRTAALAYDWNNSAEKYYKVLCGKYEK